MNTKPFMVFKEAENNVYKGVSLLKGAIVFFWTLLCLFLINKNRDFLQAAVLGGAYYLSLVVLCLNFFKGIGRYMLFPKEYRNMPVFIGHKLDTIFTYPVLLMSIIGIISNLLNAAGISPEIPRYDYTGGSIAGWELTVKSALLPLTAFAEELLNLLLVSFLYANLKFLRSFRFAGSIIGAALIFGILHSFGWEPGAAISVGLAYMPVFYATLYTGSIWISFLAHLYNDLISFAKYYYMNSHYIIIAVVTLIPVLWAVAAMFRKKAS